MVQNKLGTLFARGVAAAVAVLAFGCVRPSSEAPGKKPTQGSLTSPIRRLRRLSNREYDNVVRDLLGDATQPANQFLADTYPNGYDNGSATLAVQSDQVASYEQAAESLAATAVSQRMDRLLSGCDVSLQGEQACLESFLSSFAPRAYRRPLTATEVQRLRDIYGVGAQTSGGFTTGIRTALELILQSPQFLYREELGAQDADPESASPVVLTDYEVASELSFLLTGSMPDDLLWTAVAQGRFQTDADRQREATRLLASPGAKDTLRNFLHQWFATNRLSGLSKDSLFYPSFDAAMAASMSTELDLFYDDVLWSGTGSLRELFTSNKSFVDSTLAELYGVTASGDGFAPVDLDPTLRKGLLSRAGYLAVHADSDSSGPIPRGVFVLQAMLCLPPPPPPANVPPAPPPGSPDVQNLTTRQRFGQHVSSSFCASCHTQIDGIGFGFEEFDGIGAYRATDNGQPVDSSGTVYGTQEIDGPYVGLSQLTTKLAASRHLVDCFARQAYRYAMGQVEPTEDNLAPLIAQFSSDTSITKVLMNVVMNPLFTTRSVEASAPNGTPGP